MGFENFNLDQVSENARRRSQGDRTAADMYFDSEDGKMKVRKKGESLPRTAAVFNKMTDEGFANG